MEERLRRIEDFETFSKNSKEVFTRFNENEKNSFFQDMYMLCVVPGGRNGGYDDKMVEVFFGSRRIGKKTVYENDKRKIIGLTEQGATLRYQFFDNGYYSITLFPAFTEDQRPIEDFIYFSFSKNTKKLLNENVLRSHWNYFIAYMHSTSIDGFPNWVQKLRVEKLRLCHHLVVKNEVKPKRIAEAGKTVVKYALTVGLSGGLLSLINYFGSNSAEENQKLRLENQELKTKLSLNKKVDANDFDKKTSALQAELLLLESKYDSLENNLSNFSKNAEQINLISRRLRTIENKVKNNSR